MLEVTMTALATPSVDGYLFDQETLSDQQIQQLLIEAEQRLNSAQAEVDHPSVASEHASPPKAYKNKPEIRFEAQPS